MDKNKIRDRHSKIINDYVNGDVKLRGAPKGCDGSNR